MIFKFDFLLLNFNIFAIFLHAIFLKCKTVQS